ncbi:sensor histidine kinase [Myceligenerans crystallogenes]
MGMPGRRTLLPQARRVTGWSLAVALPALLTIGFLALDRSWDTLTEPVMLYLAVVVGVALVGGLWPGVATALVSNLCLNWFFTSPVGRLHVDEPGNVLSLGVFVVVAVAVASVVDAAARRTAQAAQARAQATALEHAERTRTALLAAVSHDLRTPLAAIRAAVDGLGATDVDLAAEDRDALVTTVAESTGRLERLIDNLLDLSRLQTGAVRPVLRDTSLEEIVPLAVEPWLEAVELDLPEDLPLVHTDGGLLERVVANLVSNAVRHAPPDRPVRVAATVTADEVEVRVTDAGPGVPDHRKASMFEPFQRLDDSGGGLGLGLAVASGLARAVGAALRARDTPGGGLTMIVSVPRARDGIGS